MEQGPNISSTQQPIDMDKLSLEEQDIQDYNQRSKYPTKFRTKQEALNHFSYHPDFFNFPSSQFYQQQYEDYLNMLSAGLKIGLSHQVLNVFPKGCFGCLIFTLAVTGHQTKKKDAAIRFLKEFTNNWATDEFYSAVLERIKQFYRSYGQNYDLMDPHELVCLRLHSDKSKEKLGYYMFQYFEKLAHAYQKGELSSIPQIKSRKGLIIQIQKIRQIQERQNQKYKIISQARKSFREELFTQNPYFAKSHIFINDLQRQNVQSMLDHISFKQSGSFIDKIMLTYRYSPQSSHLNLTSMLSSSLRWFMVKLTCGNILGGYSSLAPSKSYFFSYAHQKCFNLGAFENHEGSIRKVQDKQKQQDWIYNQSEQTGFKTQKAEEKAELALEGDYLHLIFHCKNAIFYYTIFVEKNHPLVQELRKDLFQTCSKESDNQLHFDADQLQVYEIKFKKVESENLKNVGEYFSFLQVKKSEQESKQEVQGIQK